MVNFVLNFLFVIIFLCFSPYWIFFPLWMNAHIVLEIFYFIQQFDHILNCHMFLCMAYLIFNFTRSLGILMGARLTWLFVMVHLMVDTCVFWILCWGSTWWYFVTDYVLVCSYWSSWHGRVCSVPAHTSCKCCVFYRDCLISRESADEYFKRFWKCMVYMHIDSNDVASSHIYCVERIKN